MLIENESAFSVFLIDSFLVGEFFAAVTQAISLPSFRTQALVSPLTNLQPSRRPLPGRHVLLHFEREFNACELIRFSSFVDSFSSLDQSYRVFFLQFAMRHLESIPLDYVCYRMLPSVSSDIAAGAS